MQQKHLLFFWGIELSSLEGNSLQAVLTHKLGQPAFSVCETFKLKKTALEADLVMQCVHLYSYSAVIFD